MQLPTRWIKAFKDIWGSKTRTVLVILSIAVGVFAVGMTTNARLIIQRDMIDAYLATNPASATLYIAPFEEQLAHLVEHMPEISQAEPRRSEVAQVYQGDDRWIDIELTVVPDYDKVRISRFASETRPSTPRRATFDKMRSSMGCLTVIPRPKPPPRPDPNPDSSLPLMQFFPLFPGSWGFSKARNVEVSGPYRRPTNF